ncbi:hypothetical protein E2C01_072957 [Portunus trituberculatus]|uniref:Uncharacterized protein n=1 Tax=Portunus trituberculatus TaxID=210409 RepID=A0A5B7I1H4_PORTR|nr:hypothetical protein [Portunus trituberculatus]
MDPPHYWLAVPPSVLLKSNEPHNSSTVLYARHRQGKRSSVVSVLVHTSKHAGRQAGRQVEGCSLSHSANHLPTIIEMNFRPHPTHTIRHLRHPPRSYPTLLRSDRSSSPTSTPPTD